MTDFTDIDAAISMFAVEVQGLITDHYEKNHTVPPTITVDWGRRYARVAMVNDRGTRSVHSFVDRTTGDILKAATWAAPAKHARGSVLAADRLSAVGPYGAKYLR